MRTGRLSSLADLLRRTLAAGSAALIFALGLFAASPALHQQLHLGDQPSADDHCAIVLFAGGVSLPVATVAPLPPVSDSPGDALQRANEVLLDSPRYLHQPERGPPVA
jgi:hypothetical protein